MEKTLSLWWISTLMASPEEETCRVGSDILKAFTKRFVLGALKSRKFPDMALDRAIGRCSWGVFIDASLAALAVAGVGKGKSYKYISVGSALPVRLYRAMREPQGVERAIGTDLHAFFVSLLFHETVIIYAEAGRLSGKTKFIIYAKS